MALFDKQHLGTLGVAVFNAAVFKIQPRGVSLPESVVIQIRFFGEFNRATKWWIGDDEVKTPVFKTFVCRPFL